VGWVDSGARAGPDGAPRAPFSRRVAGRLARLPTFAIRDQGRGAARLRLPLDKTRRSSRKLRSRGAERI